ncbi:methyltransferase domain-containing protein [Leptothrix discophora]|uniref:Biotin synthase n=1 Tax=Leptothrix discophora TaxID=89 RepID=A0ABT9G7P9_LEPDI|nr:biotin synthase [Leptothrix discophora]MDP4302518.1 biotin synthase [Leptothrix discophora]
MDQPPKTAHATPSGTGLPEGRTLLDPAAIRRLRERRRAAAPQPWLHGEIARRMAERLSLVRQQPAQVLDWWPERAEDTDALADACPQARLWQVEAADPAGTIRPAPAAGKPWWRSLIGKVTAPETPAAPQVDLLWSNMMLHWADPLPALLAQWHRAIRVDGFLMFSCLGPDTLRELRPIYRDAGWGEPASPFIDMHDLGDALVQAGFADPVMDMETLTLSWADAPSLLAELRSLGRNTHPRRHAGLRTPRWLHSLHKQLHEKLAGADGRLTLTFEIVYGHAFRPVPRAKVGGETTIALESMREMTRRRNPLTGA